MSAHRALTPTVLAILAASAAAYAYFVDRSTVSDTDRAARRAEVFPSFRVEDVVRIELVHGAESLVLDRSADAGESELWTMTAPRPEHADAAAVDVLLRDLERAARVRGVDPRDAVGFDAPRMRGSVRVGQLTYTFALGGDARVPEGGAYLRVDGEGTFVIGRALKVQLLRRADAYRDRAIVPYGASTVARLEVQRGPLERVVLERHGATFRIGGRGVRAARSEVDRLLLALADARADTFPDDDDADRATAQPALRVLVTPRDGAGGAPVELRIGHDCPEQPEDVILVRRAPTRLAACVPKTLDQALATGAALADTSPLFAHADEIEELRLQRLGPGGAVVDVARRGSGWHERAPADRELGPSESVSVNALALALAQARAASDEVRRAADGERFEAQARITVARTGGGATEVVEIAAQAPDGTALARRLDDGAVLLLSRAAVRRFEPHPVALRARSPWRSPFDAGAIVAVENTCGPTPERIELRDGAWTMRTPVARGAVDAESIVERTGGLARLEAEAWIAEGDDGGFGFEAAGACTVTAWLDPGSADAAPRRVGVSFGATGDGGVYAKTLDDPAVFVAPVALRRALAHPAIDHGALRVDPAEQGVTVVGGGTRRTLERGAPEAEGLARALGGVRARVALHAGPPARTEGFDHPALEIIAGGPADARPAVETRITIGARTQVDGADVYFARVSGVDATFAVPAAAIAAVADALK
jgi:hypothetical protein